MDIDEELLQRSLPSCEPYMADYLKMREHPLKVDVFCGSIDAYDDSLEGADFVFGIEVLVLALLPHIRQNLGCFLTI